MDTYINVLIGLFIGIIVYDMGFFNIIPESLSSLDGKSFNIKDKVFFVNSQSAWFVLAILLLMVLMKVATLIQLEHELRTLLALLVLQGQSTSA